MSRPPQRRRSATRIEGHPDLRRCTRCEAPKPATSEYFRPSPDGPDGFRTQCRACERTKQRKTPQLGRGVYDQATQRWMAVWNMGGVAFDSGPLQFATEAQAAQYAVATRQLMLDEAE